jgi:thiol-disulfide isomerase/thioredoxin
MAGLRNTALVLLLMAAVVWMVWPQREPMPSVTFTLTDGRTLLSEDLRGRPLLVNFWSISCDICLREMPKLTRLAESLGDRGLQVIGVAMPYDPPPAVIDSVARLAPGYPIALDPRGELAHAFGDVEVTPTTFLVAPNGSLAYSTQGPIDETRLRATLATL